MIIARIFLPKDSAHNRVGTPTCSVVKSENSFSFSNFSEAVFETAEVFQATAGFIYTSGNLLMFNICSKAFSNDFYQPKQHT